MARWNSCNILNVAPDAKRLWQLDAKGGGFVLSRELRVPHTDKMPSKGIAKNWTSLWQPKLNIAWLPLESVFLRVVELPASNFEETLSMVELQLERLSPLPVTQIVWTMHVIGTHHSPARADGTVEHLQSVVVVIAARSAVEEFLGTLEREGFLADRLETPMLDQLAAVAANEGGQSRQGGAEAWLFPMSLGGQNAALVAWWGGGALRNLSFVTLPVAGERAKGLKEQLAHIAWSGELEGWLTAEPKWHLVSDPANAAEWESALRTGLGEFVQVIAPPAPAELAARTAKRASLSAKSNLLPTEFSARYHQQFVDRLWLRGLTYAGFFYAVLLAVYFGAVSYLGYETGKVEGAVAKLSGSYTNSMQLQARYNVLKERQDLKFAALDCWKLTADMIPEGVTLQRFSFADGRKLTLSGTTSPDLRDDLFEFNSAMQKARLNDQSVFDPIKGERVNPKTMGNVVTWGFNLELLRSEAEAK